MILVPEHKSPVRRGECFGRLEVIGRPFYEKHTIIGRDGIKKWQRSRYVVCRCDCGKSTVICIGDLKRGRTKSCGCLSKENATSINVKHGEKRVGQKNSLYNTWVGMRQRCRNPRHPAYRTYGAVGIQIEEPEWENYEAFRNWAWSAGYEERLDRPLLERLALDRIDPLKGYSKSNCQWITKQENSKKVHSDNKKRIEGLENEVALLTHCLRNPLIAALHGYLDPKE